MTTKVLSQSDERILGSVFDPENSPDTPTIKIDTTLPEDPHIIDGSVVAQLRKKELQAIRLVEQYSVQLSSAPELSSGATPKVEDEAQKLQVYTEAHSILSQLISTYPLYASAYNNRAQLQRWFHGTELISTKSFTGENKDTANALDAIFMDLKVAIRLASPAGMTGTSGVVSAAQAKLLSQAWTQRGAIAWGLAKAIHKHPASPSKEQNASSTSSVQEWRTWDTMKFEEEGSRSFYMAGLYGSEAGRALAVKTNPYARLCAGIVKEAMSNEYRSLE